MAKERGPYKRYLTGETQDIPESTIRSREKKRLCQRLSPLHFEEVNEAGVVNNSTNNVVEQSVEYALEDAVAEVQFINRNDNNATRDNVNNCQLLDHINTDDEDDIADMEHNVDDYDSNTDDDDNEFLYDANPIFEINEEQYANEIEIRHHIYNNCDLSREESETLILAQALRHGFSDLALESNLLLIDCHLPRDLHVSKYHFLKKFPNPKTEKYYFCVKCSIILSFDNSDTTNCEECKGQFSKKRLDKIGHYFLYLPLKEQLIHFLNSKYFTLLRKESDDSDIVNGKYYKTLREQNIIGDNDLTIQWFTDGIKTFKSSKPSIWATLVQINELPYRCRKDHIICCSVWFVSIKPPMNMFLRPFIDELIDLHKNGFQSTTYSNNEPINIKVHSLLAPTDSVARAAIQNIKQYNGSFGCSYCLIPGETVPYGKGNIRVFCGDRHEGRSIQQHKRDCNLIVSNSELKDVNGVKGPSVIQLLPIFHIIWSFPPEYLHSVAEGVVKLLVSEMFDSKNHKKDWYLGQKVQDFDNLICSYKPPTELTRCPRSIKERATWKGSEWRNFLVYYSLLCFKPFMNKKYYEHWFLFVYSINIFLKQKISDVEYTAASKAIRLFVLDVENLYGHGGAERSSTQRSYH